MGSEFGRWKHKRRKLNDPLAVASDGVLPTDVLREILLHLPAKALCRLRLVGRSWRALGFAKAHASRHPLFAGINIFNYREIHVMDLSGGIVRRIPVAEFSFQLSTQLDLLCATSIRGPSFVLNPATGEVTTMPKCVADALGLGLCIVGHVSSTGEYKVLRIQDSRICHVMTVGGNTRWRETPGPLVAVTPTVTHRAVINGVAYFLSSFSHGSAGVEHDSIASFDLATENWKPTMLRGPLSSLLTSGDDKLLHISHRNDFRLAELNDCLVTVHQNQPNCSLDLWFLVDTDKGHWTKGYSVQWEHHLMFCTDPPYPLIVLDDGRIVMFMRQERVIRAYDPRMSTWADLAKTNYLAVYNLQGSLLCSSVP